MKREKPKTIHITLGEENRWMMTFADLLTLLLVFFAPLFAYSSTNNEKIDELLGWMKMEFGIFSGSAAQAKKKIFNPMHKEKPKGGSRRFFRGIPHDKGEILFDPLPELPLINTNTSVENLETSIRLGELGADADIVQEEKWSVITLKSKCLFSSGFAEISGEGEKVLSKIAEHLKKIKAPIRIEGHTDNVPLKSGGRYRNNWELSTARAVNVLKYLQNDCGIDPALLSAVGYGQHRPLMPNDTPEGRQINRRVEIVLFFSRNLDEELLSDSRTSHTQPERIQE